MGKGVYIWQPEKIGTPQEVVQALLDAGVDTVALKINDAGRVFTGLQPYIDAFRAVGIRFIGWGYIYLKWNALAEAKGTVEAINLYKPEMYLIDAEAQAKLQYIPATIYMNYLRPRVSIPLGLNSYWKPSYHPTLPWSQLRKQCNFDVPQVYWRGWDPVGKLRQSKKEYAAMKPRLPFLLVAGDMYIDRNLKPTPQQVTAFLKEAHDDPEIEGVLMWSMDQKFKVPELWAAMASFDWGTGEVGATDLVEPPKKLPLYSAVVTASRGLNVRSGPGTKYRIIRAEPRGYRVDVWAYDAGWATVREDCSEWMSADYLKRV